MSTVLTFPKKIKFVVDILKYEDDDGNPKQEIVICLKRQECKYTIISPATSLLRPYVSLAFKTQHEYGRRLCEFLNYVYFDENCVGKFEQITTQHIIDFLNYLGGTGHDRAYVKESKRVLSAIFYYATRKYENLCQINNSEFLCTDGKRGPVIDWPELNINVLLPSAKTNTVHKTNKITNLNTEIVLRFLELAIYEATDCALGFYFMFFGGIRANEALHLTADDIPRCYSGKFFTITLTDKLLNMNSKYSDLNQNKKPRRQSVLYIRELYDEMYNHWKNKFGSGAIVRNHSGNAMTISGFEYNFNKVKGILLQQLENGSASEKILAFKLRTFSWNTHMGRGVFSNIIAELTENPYLVPTSRGDSDFTYALPYLADSDKTNGQITDILTEMYQSMHKTDSVSAIDSTYSNENEPDNYRLGISVGNIADFDNAALLADTYGTHSLMVYCDNNQFTVPKAVFIRKYNLVIHGPLSINLAAEDEKQRKASVNRVAKIIERCNKFSNYITALVLHPGNAEDDCQLMESLKTLLSLAKFNIAIETMAGKGKELMSNLDALKYFTESLGEYHNLKICVDTCHMNDAGYDLSDYDTFVNTLMQYYEPEDIAVFHINDSKNPVGSHMDRHANIGNGTIPVTTLARLVQDDRFITIPKILETPPTTPGITFADEMRMLIGNVK